MNGSVPANDLIAAFSQTLLHELAVQATSSYRLARGRSSSATCTNGYSASSNIFQIWFVATEQ